MSPVAKKIVQPTVQPQKLTECKLEKYKKRYSHLFSRLPLTKIVNAKFGKKLADEELGLDYLKSPEEIKQIIWPNNFFLKIYTRIIQFLL